MGREVLVGKYITFHKCSDWGGCSPPSFLVELVIEAVPGLADPGDPGLVSAGEAFPAAVTWWRQSVKGAAAVEGTFKGDVL